MPEANVSILWVFTLSSEAKVNDFFETNKKKGGKCMQAIPLL